MIDQIDDCYENIMDQIEPITSKYIDMYDKGYKLETLKDIIYSDIYIKKKITCISNIYGNNLNNSEIFYIIIVYLSQYIESKNNLSDKTNMFGDIFILENTS